MLKVNKRLTSYRYTCSIVDDECEVGTYDIDSWEYMNRRDIRDRLDTMGYELITYTVSQITRTYSADLQAFLSVAKPV